MVSPLWGANATALKKPPSMHHEPLPAPHAPTECSGQACAARGWLGGRRAPPVARPYRAAEVCSWDARGPLDARNLHQAGQGSPRASPGHGDTRGYVRGGLQRAGGGLTCRANSAMPELGAERCASSARRWRQVGPMNLGTVGKRSLRRIQRYHDIRDCPELTK